jgi:2-polyprenyl-6-methoxyphenol hydroxylase-like FAD-dependent oxidoreductase
MRRTRCCRTPLEDAVALGLVLAKPADVTHALRRYESVRMRRTDRFMALGPRIARMTTTTNPLIDAVRTAGIRLVPEGLLAVGASRALRDPHAALRSPQR